METDWISEFLDYLRFEKRVSPHTTTAYATDLRQFSEYLLEQTAPVLPEAASRQLVRGWMVQLVAAGMNPVTVNRKMASLRAFYKYLRKKKAVDKDPSGLLSSLKKPLRPPGFVEEKSMEQLLEHVEFADDASGLRDRLVLELLYGTGIRLSELTGLKTTDVNLPARTLRVLGKRSRERIIPFNKGLGELLQQYLLVRKPAQPHDFLLLTDAGSPVYPVMVQRLVKRYLTYVTSLEHKGPHVLRHTYATHLLNRGADLNAIKELLGHSSLAATQIYTHNAIEELKKTFLQAHPKA